MPSVDDRVVRMQFDNASFESKISTTLGSIDKLNKALKFDGATKGLSDVQSHANKFSLDTVSQGIEGVSKKFLAMSTIGITALSKITSEAINAGGNLIRSSVQQISDGFSEYETNIGSIQTILANTASKGTTLDQVNGALNQLNIYSDKTIYNFSQMAKNIGTFTAAGLDLNTSTQSIKGIANLAAMSGSTADQASSLMYQLSQAMAAGTLKAQDWISVVNAGVGGEAFKSSLFETAKAFKTIKNVPLGESFAEWTKKGGNFKQAMSDGVFTADVLSTTLQGFTGDLTESQLVAKGYSKQQADQIMKTAKVASAAAQDVKTFTQLISTVKESIGTGWADTMGIVFGTFTEAKATFTDFNNRIGAAVSKMSKARNNVLKDWKALGGRTFIIYGIVTAFKNLIAIIKPIKEAFRSVFPPVTGKRLAELSKGFLKLAIALKPTKGVIGSLKSIFTGLFSILSIGVTIIKGIAGVIVGLVKGLLNLGGTDVLGGLAGIGDFFTNLQKGLVKGGAITAFFEKIGAVVQTAIGHIDEFAHKIGGIFTKFKPGVPDGVSTGLGRVGDRLSTLQTVADKAKDMWTPFINGLKKVSDFINKVWAVLGDFFSNLGHAIADSMGSGNFSPVLDAINTGLFAALILLVRKFIKKGLKFDVGGIFEKLGKTFEQLTGVLKSLQAQIKAQAIKEIAIAIAILTASMLVLSLIDSKALTKALVAMSTGFAQLIATFAIINKMEGVGPKSAATFALIAGGLILLSIAVAILSLAARNLAGLSWEQIAKGLTGLTLLIGGLLAAVKVFDKMEKDVFKVGAQLILLALAVNILGIAVGRFAKMNPGQMAKGFLAATIGLGALVLAINKMPDVSRKDFAVLKLSIALFLLSFAVDRFAKMDPVKLAKGMGAIALGLYGIGVGLSKMPPDMEQKARGLLLVSAGLLLVSVALKIIGQMSIGQIASALITLSAALAIMVIGVNAMEEAAPGAPALLIVAAALAVLAIVIKMFADIPFGDMLKGLLGMVIVIAVLTAVAAGLSASGLIGALAGLGAALALVGLGFALFGVGAYLTAKALETLSKLGGKSAESIGQILKEIGKSIPAIAQGMAEGFIQFLDIVMGAAPKIVEGLAKILGLLIVAITKLMPQVTALLTALITTAMAVIRSYVGEYIKTGIFIIMSLLQGIRDNIYQITSLVIEIVLEFLSAVEDHMDEIVGAGVGLLLSFLSGIANNIIKIADTVVNIIVSFINAISDNIQKIIDAGTDLVVKFIEGISNASQRILDAGSAAIIKFFNGLKDRGPKVLAAISSAATELIGDFITETVKVLVATAGDIFQGIIDLLNGLADVIRKKSADMGRAWANVAEAIADGFGTALVAGLRKLVEDKLPGPLGDIAGGIVDGIASGLGISSPSKETMHLGEMTGLGFQIGVVDSMHASVGPILKSVNTTMSAVSDSMSNMDKFQPTITPVLDLTQVQSQAGQINGMIPTHVVSASFSTGQANTINAQMNANQQINAENSPGGTPQIKFEQTINAPEQLSTADIYKNTRNQITLAKEELGVR